MSIPFRAKALAFLTSCIGAFFNPSFGQTSDVQAQPTIYSNCMTPPVATNRSVDLSCKLSSKKLIKRKETVLQRLKNKIAVTCELPDGYAFKFSGSDMVLDEINAFIKTERTCCAFFIFGLSISGDQSEIWLQLTGPEGAKDFIREELGLVN
jgi:hypothetical protein